MEVPPGKNVLFFYTFLIILCVNDGEKKFLACLEISLNIRKRILSLSFIAQFHYKEKLVVVRVRRVSLGAGNMMEFFYILYY